MIQSDPIVIYVLIQPGRPASQSRRRTRITSYNSYLLSLEAAEKALFGSD